MTYFYIYAISSIEGQLCASQGLCVPDNELARYKYIFDFQDEDPLPLVKLANDWFFHKVKSELHKFKYDHKSKGYIDFLDNIPIDTYFVVYHTKIKTSLSLNMDVDFIKVLYESNNKVFSIAIGDSLSSIYNIYAWFQGKDYTYIGEPDKRIRKCRFCGKSHPEVKFKKKAHAISESLGNTKLFNNEECDNCNHNFGITIEQDFFNHLSVYYYTFHPKGKGGLRKFNGETFSIDNKGDRKITIKTNIKSPSIEEIANEGLHLSLSESRISFVKQNVYKCLCKYAVSFIDSKYINRFQQTIDWLRTDITYSTLPLLWVKESYCESHPSIAIYIAKEGIDKHLEFVVRLQLSNMEFLYTFPFVDNNPVAITAENLHNLSNVFKLEDYHNIDYTSIDKENFEFKFNLNPAELVEIDNLEYESLTLEQLSDKYPNSKGFAIKR